MNPALQTLGALPDMLDTRPRTVRSGISARLSRSIRLVSRRRMTSCTFQVTDLIGRLRSCDREKRHEVPTFKTVFIRRPVGCRKEAARTVGRAGSKRPSLSAPYSNVLKSWRETFDMVMTDDGTWTWKPFWEDHWRIVDKTEHESGSGPSVTWRDVSLRSAQWRRADSICSR